MNDKLKRLLPYTIVIVSFFVGLIILYVLIDNFLLPSLVKNREIVQTPDLTGKSLDEAQRILADNKLLYQVAGEQYNEGFQQGQILNQQPKPGTEVKIGRTVYVTVSKGKETVGVPHLIGKNLRQARIVLMEKGLQLGETIYEFSDLFGLDTIISQNPYAGSTIPYGNVINIIVSKGTDKQVMVPSLIGLPIDDAQSILRESGLTVGTTSYKHSETYFPNTVMDQTPRSGEVVQTGFAINVVISK